MSRKRGYKNSKLRSKRMQRFVLSNLTRRVLRDDMYKKSPITRPFRTYKKIQVLKRRTSILNKNKHINTNKKPQAKKWTSKKIMLDKGKICRDRSDRRRALFRTGRAGSGTAGPAKKWMTIKSYVRCK